MLAFTAVEDSVCVIGRRLNVWQLWHWSKLNLWRLFIVSNFNHCIHLSSFQVTSPEQATAATTAASATAAADRDREEQSYDEEQEDGNREECFA